MLTSLPFLSRWSFLETIEDTRTVLFSCWLDLANDKILSSIDCGVLFFRSLAPHWIMIRSGLLFSVGLIYDSMSSGFAPDLTTNKLCLADNSQPLTFLTMESPTISFSFLFCPAFMHMLIFFMSLFPRFTCRNDMLAVTLFDNLSLSLLHPFVSLSFESLRTSYLFCVIIVSLSWVLSLILKDYVLGVWNSFFSTLCL